VIGYATLQPNRWLTVGGEFGRMQNLRLSSAAGPFNRDYPDALVMFSAEPGVSERPDYLHGAAKVTADTRNYDSRPTSGGLYRASVAAYSDRDYGRFSFQQYEVEALQFLPVKGDAWTLALHGWGVFSDTSSGNDVPFYLLAGLGGKNTLRGYYDFRFHDRNLLLASAESRWALLRDVDVAAFFDAGNVSARTGSLNLKKTSWGTGLRLHTQTATLARIDVGHGQEGWRVFASLDDPFRLKRLTRRGLDVPFVP
jgi:outer membrane protein assembly factor BamA